jgi:hypothetical protein
MAQHKRRILITVEAAQSKKPRQVQSRNSRHPNPTIDEAGSEFPLPPPKAKPGSDLPHAASNAICFRTNLSVKIYPITNYGTERTISPHP